MSIVVGGRSIVTGASVAPLLAGDDSPRGARRRILVRWQMTFLAVWFVDAANVKDRERQGLHRFASLRVFWYATGAGARGTSLASRGEAMTGTRRWVELAAALLLGVLFGFAVDRSASPDVPEGRYMVGNWPDADHKWNRLYRCDTYTGATWWLALPSQEWHEIPQPIQSPSESGLSAVN